jgi:hypothetical protein
VSVLQLLTGCYGISECDPASRATNNVDDIGYALLMQKLACPHASTAGMTHQVNIVV